MKLRTNISALLLALLVFVASNGFAVFEHICNTAQTHSYSFFKKPVCEMEKQVAPCCAKRLGLTKKKKCCDHKQFFSKLSIEGFTAKQLFLKPLEKQISADFFSINFYLFNQQVFENHYSGLSPPDNLYQIKSILQPSSVKLQVFRC